MMQRRALSMLLLAMCLGCSSSTSRQASHDVEGGRPNQIPSTGGIAGEGGSGAGVDRAGTGGTSGASASGAGGTNGTKDGGSGGEAGAPQIGGIAGVAGAGGVAGVAGAAGMAGSGAVAGLAGAAGNGGALNCPDPFTDNLMLWLSADVGTIGNPVVQWEDRSTASNTAMQADPNLQPILVADSLNGKPVVRFDGVDDNLDLPSGFDDFSAGISGFIVARYSSDVGRGRILGLKNDAPPGGAILVQRQLDTHDFIYMATDLDGTSAADVTVTAPNAIVLHEAALLSFVHVPSGNVEVHRNGTSVASNVFALPPIMVRNGNQIGSEWNGEHAFAGDLAEVLLYDRALTAAERQQNECYLMQKWGLPQ